MVTIKSYEIAKLFGLDFIGCYEQYEDFYYEFKFNGKEINIHHGHGDDDAVDEDEAKEEAAKRVLLEIGKRTALDM